jgi:hypothetical protein
MTQSEPSPPPSENASRWTISSASSKSDVGASTSGDEPLTDHMTKTRKIKSRAKEEG